MRSQTLNFRGSYLKFGIVGALAISVGTVAYLGQEIKEQTSEAEIYRDARRSKFPTLIKRRYTGNGVFTYQKEDVTFVAQLDSKHLYISGIESDYLGDARMTAEQLCGQAKVVSEGEYRGKPSQVLELEQSNPSMDCLERR